MIIMVDRDILVIIIFDLIGISVFVWFLWSRLSAKLKIIEQRKMNRSMGKKNTEDSDEP